ncbi:MAG: enoyl-CoA hydratase-related protein [Burkholderiales bacterium]
MSSPQSRIVDVRIEKRAAGHVAHVIVNNPQHRNRLGKSGKDDLVAAFSELAKDDKLRVAVLTGAGDKSFISGSDLAEMKDLDAAGQIEVSTKTHLACDSIRRLPVPVIARVNGFCLGSGMELAASCDMRVATDVSRFGMPEVKFGIPSGMEACLLPGLVGWGKARELVFTGELMEAREAYRCGFVDRLVSASELDEAVEKWVASICAAGPCAIRLQKALVQDWERMTIKDAVQRGIAAMGESRATDEPVRMMQAFVDRKKR